MTDILSPEERSRNMSAIKCRDTAPEVYFRKKLFALGLRYRKNSGSVCGHPDIFLRRYNTAVFVNGCFWHRHANCKYAYTPHSRVEFWEKKFAGNIRHDQVVRQELYAQGIRVLIVWECTIHQMQRSEEMEGRILEKAAAFLRSAEMYLEL